MDEPFKVAQKVVQKVVQNFILFLGPVWVWFFISGGLVGNRERPPQKNEGWDT